KRGLAQSIFQVGGNAGTAIGPLLAAIIIVPYGRSHILYFSLLAMIAIFVLITIGKWYKNNAHLIKPKHNNQSTENIQVFSKKKITFSVIRSEERRVGKECRSR